MILKLEYALKIENLRAMILWHRHRHRCPLNTCCPNLNYPDSSSFRRYQIAGPNDEKKVLTIDLLDWSTLLHKTREISISSIMLSSACPASHNTCRLRSSSDCKNVSTSTRFHPLTSLNNLCRLRMLLILTRILMTPRFESFVLSETILKHASWPASRDAKYTTTATSALVQGDDMMRMSWKRTTTKPRVSFTI